MSFNAGRYGRAVLAILVLLVGAGCSKAPDDAQATQQIQARLSQDSGLQGKSLTVQTSAGVVTLSGTVDNDAQRTAAARYASEVPGIKQVVNNLEVASQSGTPTPEKQPDTTVATARRSESKPRPSVTRRQRDVPDQNFWDKGNSNTGKVNSDPPPTAATTTPVSAPPAPATPPPPPEPRKLTIQSGTAVSIRLVDSISSETAEPGQTFQATLDAPLTAEGEVAIPSGYKAEGHVVDVKSAGKFAGKSLLVLQLDRVSAGGKYYSIETNQYSRQGSNRTTNTAEKVGAGAAIGAIIGGLAGGGKGAGIGAAAGGGLGGGVQAATKGQQIKLPSETVLTFTLASPVTVTKVDRGPGEERKRLDTPQ